MTEEERREMTRSNYAAQMEMLGYDNSGNPLEMVRVTHGRWVRLKGSLWLVGVCSICGTVYVGCSEAQFCPHCGAKMDGGPDA